MAGRGRLVALLAGGLAVLVGIVVAFGATRDPEIAATSAGRPNVIFIVTDDQRADGTLGVMPETTKWFQREGTHFVNAHTTTPLCCPARASILTGRYTHNHQALTNELGAASDFDHATTIQRYLQEVDYVTGLFGKYLTSEPVEDAPPFFDRWSLMRFGYRDVDFNVQGDLREVADYSTNFIERQAIDFLRETEENDGQPWFAYVAVNAPHRPFLPEPRFADADVRAFESDPATEERDLSDKPPAVSNADIALDFEKIRSDQLRTLMSVDELVGAVFETLGELDEIDSTLAIFISDNGFFWGEHGLTDKRSPYSPSVRVPLFVRWPGHFQKGGVDRRLAANLDLLPTVLDALGIDPAHEVDGRSLLDRWDRKFLFSEYFKDPGYELPSWAALSNDRLRYVRYYRRNRVIFEEYYDLRADPFEVDNLLAPGTPESNRPRLDPLIGVLEAARRCHGVNGVAACP